MILLRYWPLLSAVITVGTATPLPENSFPGEASEVERSPNKGRPDPISTLAVGTFAAIFGKPLAEKTVGRVKDWFQERKLVDADRQSLTVLSSQDVYGLCLEALTKDWLEKNGFLKRDAEDSRPLSPEVEIDRMTEAKGKAMADYGDLVNKYRPEHDVNALARGEKNHKICSFRKEAEAIVVKRRKKDRKIQRDIDRGTRSASNSPRGRDDASQFSMSTQKENLAKRLLNSLPSYWKPPVRRPKPSEEARGRQPFGPAGGAGVGPRRPIHYLPRRL